MKTNRGILPELIAAVVLLGLIFQSDAAERFYRGRIFRKSQFGLKQESLVGLNDDNNTLWFDQELDHYSPSDIRQWKQRYFVNDSFFKPGGPVFLIIGGEGEASSKWMVEGAWITYAQKLNALCFQLEHRYYGKSHPTPDLSLTNLKYLSSEQALADLASFTQGMKEKYNLTDNKWVAFGGSYPGSLAAWYRLKYPHLVDIAVSTSAPLVAQLDFKEYLGGVRDSIKRTNPVCLEQIKLAVEAAEGLLKRRTGWWMLQKKFKLCDPLNGGNSKDVAAFFETLTGNFEDIVQYNEDNRAWEGSETANITIKTLCDIMTTNVTGNNENDDTSPLDRYALVNDLMLNTTGKNCTDYKCSKMVKEMQQEKWDSSVASGERQWTWQTCTEFGFFQSSDLEDQPFGKEFPIAYSVKQCRDIYGTRFNQTFLEKEFEWTNSYYGGKNIKVTRVIFVNGNIDPWHALGITSQNDTTDDNFVIFIDGTAHCANMYPDAPSDLPQLKDARKQILSQLTKWLST